MKSEEPFITKNFYEFETLEEKERALNEWNDQKVKESEDKNLKFPRIGSVAFELRRTEVEDKAIWDNVIEFISRDKYNPSLEENVRALEGLSFYKKISEKPKKNYQKSHKNTPKVEGEVLKSDLDRALDKLEYNIERTMWNENMVKYLRIAENLYNLDRKNSSKIFEMIEKNILGDLAMNYTTQTILDTMYYFSLCG